MSIILKRDPAKFLEELKVHYGDVWKIPESDYLIKPDFVVVDPQTGKKTKVSFVSLDDGEIVGVVYDILA